MTFQELLNDERKIGREEGWAEERINTAREANRADEAEQRANSAEARNRELESEIARLKGILQKKRSPSNGTISHDNMK